MSGNRETVAVQAQDALRNALRPLKAAFAGVGVFSMAANLLMLTGPLFMLQIYDRVLTSRSIPTLVALFALAAVLYGFYGLFDFVRARVLSRIGHNIDMTLMTRSFRLWIVRSTGIGGEAGRPAADLTTIRQFMGGQGLPALFDLPWAPIYLAVIFLLHVWLGLLASAGAVAVGTIAIVNQWAIRKPITDAALGEFTEARAGEQIQRNSEAVVAMGMTGNVTAQWQQLRMDAMQRQQAAGDISEIMTSASRALRLLVQSAILALGAYLAINQEISAGTIIAASILAGRALAPVDQTIANWRGIQRAKGAYDRLSQLFRSVEPDRHITALPDPSGRLSVSNVTKLAPGRQGDSGDTILQGMNFELKPGDALGVIGPSAAGKTTLARLLVGILPPDRGAVRIDGATHDQWDADELGRHIGYLPQSIELLNGSVHQNIARFEPDAPDSDVIAAAKLAGVHEMILSLPDGYATQIGPGRAPLSGGQAQRIALARAVFRQPALVVLDEPNSNLDPAGDHALTSAIEVLRTAGSVVVVMAHRPSAIAAVNLILMLQNGRQIEFGPKADVLRKVTRVAEVPSGADAVAR